MEVLLHTVGRFVYSFVVDNDGDVIFVNALKTANGYVFLALKHEIRSHLPTIQV